MRSLRTLPALLIVGLALAGDPAGAESRALGRLFFTPETRSTLDRQRQLNLHETKTLEGESVRIDGVVVRSSGKSTVWINQRPQTENATDGVAITVGAKHPERVQLAPAGEAPTDLKVGVTLNRNTRETTGGLTDGEVRVRRLAPPR